MREYIEERDYEFLGFFESLYNIRPLDDSEPWYTKEAQERWNKSVNHSLWSAFEHFMGNPNTTEMLELSISVTEGMPKIGVRDHMDFYWKDHFKAINKLPRYVKEWIETIDTDNINPQNSSLINSKDLFFSFNYTDVLEKVYGVDDVLHIHGGVTSVCDIEPIMGHCNKGDIVKHREWAKEADADYAEAEVSIQNAVADYLEKIYKDTKSQILMNNGFFDKLCTVNRVVILGWSGGDADLPYLQEIIGRVSSDTNWKVYWHSDRDYHSLKTTFGNLDNMESHSVKFVQSDEFWNMT